jgi:DNA-binding NarL/FixJ family response regulator
MPASLRSMAAPTFLSERFLNREVEKHVSNLLAKLGLSSRTEVVRLLAAAPARMG